MESCAADRGADAPKSMIPDPKQPPLDRSQKSHAVSVYSRLVQSLLAWVYLVTYFYDGAPYDYVFEVGNIMLTEESAQAVVVRHDYDAKAQELFIREVALGVAH